MTAIHSERDAQDGHGGPAGIPKVQDIGMNTNLSHSQDSVLEFRPAQLYANDADRNVSKAQSKIMNMKRGRLGISKVRQADLSDLQHGTPGINEIASPEVNAKEYSTTATQHESKVRVMFERLEFPSFQRHDSVDGPRSSNTYFERLQPLPGKSLERLEGNGKLHSTTPPTYLEEHPEGPQEVTGDSKTTEY